MINPRKVCRRQKVKYWFKCNICNHSFSKSLNDIITTIKCKFCTGGRDICNDDSCKLCFENSFANHPFAMFWDLEKNHETPRKLREQSSILAWFKCIKCNYEKHTSPNRVVKLKSFCKCKN